MRKQFASFAKSVLQDRENVSVLLGDISVGLFIDQNEQLPARVYNVGILEQSMISMAAGMSSQGYDVFVHTISPFIVERAYEQIKLDIGYNKNKVIMVSANGPADYNKLGPTHHCFSDVPLLKLIPEIDIYLPGQREDVHKCLHEALAAQSSSYIRLTSRDSNLAAVSSAVNQSNDVRSENLNILLGESLQYLEANKGRLIVDDWLYSYKIENIDLCVLDKYSKLIFWEPYSSPVAGLYYKQLLNPTIQISSMVYPLVFEKGIFDHPGFHEVVI